MRRLGNGIGTGPRPECGWAGRPTILSSVAAMDQTRKARLARRARLVLLGGLILGWTGRCALFIKLCPLNHLGLYHVLIIKKFYEGPFLLPSMSWSGKYPTSGA